MKLIQRLGPVYRNAWFKRMAATLLVVALSEVQVYLHAASPFRFGLGAIVLMGGVVLDSSLSPFWLGLASGTTYLAERVARVLLNPPGILPTPALVLLEDAIQTHYPAAMTLVVLGLVLALVQVRRWMTSPFTGYVVLVAADTIASFSQFLVRPAWKTYSTMQIIIVIALIRAATVSGIYWMWRAKAAAVAAVEQRNEYERLLLLLANLNSELFYLQKSGQDLSRIMATSVQLVKRADAGPGRELALAIAKDAHDLRADYWRIAGGLGRLVKARPVEATMEFTRMLELVAASGRSTAQRMGKAITITTRVEPDFATAAYMIWVSILNNLVTNSLEAANETGAITITARVAEGWVTVEVQDDGPGVEPTDLPILLHPGYTTKFDPDSGHPSRGLGLAQVGRLVARMHGTLEFPSAAPGDMCVAIRTPYADATEPFPGMDILAAEGAAPREREEPALGW